MNSFRKLKKNENFPFFRLNSYNLSTKNIRKKGWIYLWYGGPEYNVI